MGEVEGRGQSLPGRYGDAEPGLHGLLDHLGLPFYYRHTPDRLMARVVLWVSLVGMVGLVLLHFGMMPLPRETFLFKLTQLSFFRNLGRFDSQAAGLHSLFNFAMVLGVSFTCIIAPLFATFSMAQERASGTLGFLQLTPLSPTAIVLGKMLGPVWVLHLVGGSLLLLGVLSGYAGGYEITDLALACLFIALGSLVLHALGSFCAILIPLFRGFGALAVLLGIGFLVSILPAAAATDREFRFLALLSPWGALNVLFWRPEQYLSGAIIMSLGQGLNLTLVAGASALLELLVAAALVWAGVRKLPGPHRTALPRVAWLILWGLVVLIAFGLAWQLEGQLGMGRPAHLRWLFAAVVLGFGAGSLGLLILLDIPYDREAALADECEWRVGRSKARPYLGVGWRQLLFVSSVVVATGLGIIVTCWLAEVERRLGRLDWRALWPETGPSVAYPWAMCWALLLLVAYFIVLACVVLETASLRMRSFNGRLIFAAVGLAILSALTLAPVIHCASLYGRWASGLGLQQWRVSTLEQLQNPQLDADQRRNLEEHLRNMDGWYGNERAMPMSHFSTRAELDAERSRFELAPLALTQRYHPTVLPTYLLLLTAGGLLLFFLRRRAYRVLEREAAGAILSRRPVAAPASVSPPGLSVPAVAAASVASAARPRRTWREWLIPAGWLRFLAGGKEGPVESAPPAWFTALESRWRRPGVRGSGEGRAEWWQHLGLPLYYRHTPAAGIVRAGLAGLALLVLLFLVGRCLLFPAEPLSWTWNLQQALSFSSLFGLYPRELDGYLALFSLLVTLATLLSVVLGPLYATYSLAQERESGTLSFLRLAPLTTPGIVLGKLFGSTWLLQLCSACLLLLALPLGYVAGVPLLQIALLVQSVVLGGLFFYAAGGYLSTLPLSLKGFAGVFALIFLQLVTGGVSVDGVREGGLSFLCYLSPWGAWEMVSRSWPERSYSGHEYRSFEPALLAALDWLVLIGQAAILLGGAVALLWAAVRKLEDPAQSALPRRVWLALWLAGLALAVGTAFNPVTIKRNRDLGVTQVQFPQGQKTVARYRSRDSESWYERRIESESWGNAIFVLLAGCGVLAGLAFCDHGFSRERAVRQLVQGGQGRGARAPPHWLPVAVLVLATSLVFCLFQWNRIAAMIVAGQTGPEALGLPILSLLAWILLVPAVTWVGATLLEALAIRVTSPAVLMFAPGVVLAGCVVLVLLPVAHVQSVAGDWQTWQRGRRELPQWEAALAKLPPPPPVPAGTRLTAEQQAQERERRSYRSRIDTWRDRALELQEEHRFESLVSPGEDRADSAGYRDPLGLMVRCHPWLSLLYGLIWLGSGFGAWLLLRLGRRALARQVLPAARAAAGPALMGKSLQPVVVRDVQAGV